MPEFHTIYRVIGLSALWFCTLYLLAGIESYYKAVRAEYLPPISNSGPPTPLAVFVLTVMTLMAAAILSIITLAFLCKAIAEVFGFNL